MVIYGGEESDHKLTGRVRYRRGDERLSLFARQSVLICQVEECYTFKLGGMFQITERRARWRDMKTTDLRLIKQIVEDGVQ